MATLNGVPFEVTPLPGNKRSLKSPYTMKPKRITVHNTYNDAAARNEIAYMHRNTLSVSYHLAIDHIRAVQGLDFLRNGWHAGDGKNGYGNRNTIGVEICYSKSGGSRYDKAEDNAIKVIAQLMITFNLNIKDINKHQDWSGKNCPHRILSRSRGWQGILNEIEKEWNRLKGGDGTVSGTYKVVKSINGYATATDAKARKNKKANVAAGSYHVFNRSDGMVNVSAKIGVPGSWINPGDNITASKKPSRNPRIKTGGLKPNSLSKVAGWLTNKGWYWTAAGSEGNNPKITTGGLASSMQREFEAYLKKQDYWYEVL